MITVSSWKEALQNYLYLKNKALVDKELDWIHESIADQGKEQISNFFSRLYQQQQERNVSPLKTTLDIQFLKIKAQNNHRVEIALTAKEGILYKIGDELYKQEMEGVRMITLVQINEKWVVESERTDKKIPFPSYTFPYLRRKSREVSYYYDRLQAVKYADIWWNDYNPSFPTIKENDCTNYISQCLYAGGIPMDYSSHRNQGWWYNGKNEQWSFTWTVANSFRWYLENGGHIKVQPVEGPEYLSIGDVICYDFDGNGHWQHNTIVTAKDLNGMPLVNAHTTNSWHRYWDYRDSSAYTPQIQYRFFHLL